MKRSVTTRSDIRMQSRLILAHQILKYYTEHIIMFSDFNKNNFHAAIIILAITDFRF